MSSVTHKGKQLELALGVTGRKVQYFGRLQHTLLLISRVSAILGIWTDNLETHRQEQRAKCGTILKEKSVMWDFRSKGLLKSCGNPDSTKLGQEHKVGQPSGPGNPENDPREICDLVGEVRFALGRVIIYVSEKLNQILL